MKIKAIDGGNYGIKRCRLRWKISLPLCLAMLLLSLVGCAPSLYSVNMRYVPADSDRQVKTVAHPYTVTVATFEDLRKIDDDMQIGRVIKSNGQSIPVLPKFVKPPQAVTRPLKEFFQQAGYKVSAESPVWNLKETDIRKEWGDILVGGSIDELDVTCMESFIAKKYTAKVKLTTFFADTKSGKIFHMATIESSTSLDHVLFSEEYLEQQINIALTGAIDKITKDQKLADVLRTGTSRQL